MNNGYEDWDIIPENGQESFLMPEEIQEILLNTREQGQMMEQLIHNQIEVKDEMIDKLHRELESYRQGAADRFAEQVMKAVIKIRKDMVRRTSSWDEEMPDADEACTEYGYILDDLTDLLEQQNIDAYSTDPGELFDAAIHQAKLETTDNPALDRTIRVSLSEGYRKGDKILLPERVVVYQYKA